MFESAAKCTSLTARAFWLIFAKTLAFGFGFVLPLLLVRRLSQTEFGLYKQAFLVVGTASGILPLSFSMSAFYFLAGTIVVANLFIFVTPVPAQRFAPSSDSE